MSVEYNEKQNKSNKELKSYIKDKNIYETEDTDQNIKYLNKNTKPN